MLFIKSGKKSLKSDEELITEYRSFPDPAIIDILFDRYCHLVFAVSMKYLKNEDESKDASIHTFEKLPKDLLTYSIHNFSSWLHTVTKNYCLRVLSKNKKINIDVGNLPDKPDEEDESFAGFYLPHLEASINELSDQQKTCIQLFYLQKLSYQEVSEKTGFSMNEVKSFIQNGKRNLKIILLRKSNDAE